MMWLPFKKRCEFRLLCLIHKTLILRRPGYLSVLLTCRQILHHLNSLILLYSSCQMDAMQCSLALSLELRHPDGIYCLTIHMLI